MMNYDMMSGGLGGGCLACAWLTYILVNIALVLGIAVLWKYLQKK